MGVMKGPEQFEKGLGLLYYIVIIRNPKNNIGNYFGFYILKGLKTINVVSPHELSSTPSTPKPSSKTFLQN